MGKKRFVYSGSANLEAMEGAVNYNNYLLNFVESEAARFTKRRPKILDFGAGSGTYLDMLKERGIDADCLEPDKKQQAILKDKGCKTVFSYAKDLQPESYDLVFAFNVLEHIEDDEAVFRELSAALKKGGSIIIYVPAFKALWSAMDNLVGHYRRYRKERLDNFAKKAGLAVTKLYYCDPAGFAATLVYRIAGNGSGTISPTAVRYYDRIAFPISRTIEPFARHAFGKNVVMVAKK